MAMRLPSNLVFLRAGLLASVLSLVCALVLAFPTSSAGAQIDDETAAAREHFREGLALADRGDWEVALLEFERALVLRDSPAVRVNLAHTLEHLGRLVDALSQLDHLEDGGEASRAVTLEAQALRDELTPRIGRIVVAVRGETANTEVQVAGRPIARDAWRSPIAADPGSVTVALRRGESVLDTTEVTVPEGGVAHVTLGVVAADLSPAGVGGEGGELGGIPGSLALDDGGGENVAETWWLWTIVGVAVGGVVAAVIAGVLLSQPPSPTSGDFMPGVLEIGP
jgi:hypothetical protein